MFITTGRQKGRLSNLAERLGDERGTSAALREEVADERRRRESTESRLDSCLAQRESMKVEISALAKVITAEAHLQALSEQMEAGFTRLFRLLEVKDR